MKSNTPTPLFRGLMAAFRRARLSGSRQSRATTPSLSVPRILQMLSAVLFYGCGVQAANINYGTLNFSDVGVNPAFLPNGYHGLNWTNFLTADTSVVPNPVSGYHTVASAASPSRIGFVQGSGLIGEISAPGASDTFNFTSAVVAAAWNNGMSLRVRGYLDGAPVPGYDITITISYTPAVVLNANFVNVDRVTFESTGGTNAGLGGQFGQHFAIDNIVGTAAAPPTPGVISGTATGTVMEDSISHQWANSVIAVSSEFSHQEPPANSRWKAIQALGVPDTLVYGDVQTAWAPSSQDGTSEFLTVGFPVAVNATEVHVRETWGNGFVTQIDFLNAANTVVGSTPVTDNTPQDHPGTLIVPVPGGLGLIKGVKIYVNTSHRMGGFEEIDGVRLVAAGTDTAGSTLTVTDPNPGENVFQTPGSLAGTYGTFTFNPTSGVWGYTLNNALPATNALKDGQVVTDTLTVTSADGGDSENIVVTILGHNDTPAIAATLPSVTVNEGSPVVNAGTFSDPEGNSTVTIYASVGTVTQNVAGSWSWSYLAPNGTVSPTVTITAQDDQSGINVATFTLNINNVAPDFATGGNELLTGTDVIPSSSPFYRLINFTDPGFEPGWTATVNYGDPGSSTGPAYVHNGHMFIELSHTYSTFGIYTVTVTLSDGEATVLKTFIVERRVVPTFVPFATKYGTVPPAGVTDGARYQRFYDSALNYENRVIFSADLSGGAGTAFDSGTWTFGSTGALSLVLRAGTDIDGIQSVGRVFAYPRISDDGVGIVQTNAVGAGPMQVAQWVDDGSTSVSLFAQKTNVFAPVPANSAFTGFTYTSQNQDTGEGFFASNLVTGGAGVGAVTTANDSGVWMTDDAGTVVDVAREGETLSTVGTGLTQAEIQRVAMGAGDYGVYRGLVGGTGVTRANSVVVLRRDFYAGDDPELVARTDDPAAGLPGLKYADFLGETINTNGAVLFWATLSGPGVTNANRRALFSDRNESVQLVARYGQDLSATFGGPVTLGAINAYWLLDNGTVVVRGTLAGAGITVNNDQFVISISDTGVITKLIREGDVSTVIGNSVIDILHNVDVSPGGKMVVIASTLNGTGDSAGNLNNAGVLLGDVATPGVYTLTLRKGDIAPGYTKRVWSFSMTQQNVQGGTGSTAGMSRSVNEKGKITITFVLYDNDEGVFVGP